MSSNLVIVAIPARDEKVWKVSSEKVPHLTLLFLGENTEDVPKVERIVDFVEHAVSSSGHGPCMLDVDERGTLGEDNADVLFFEKKGYSTKWLREFRNQLLKNNDIRAAYESVDQYPEWLPHLTLGYPESPANEEEIPDHGLNWIVFDRIAVWTEDSEGPEFKLEWPEDGMELAYHTASMNDARKALGLDSVVEHFGIKGMKWGVRRDPKDTTVRVGGRNKQVTAKKAVKLDKAFEEKATSLGVKIELHNAVHDQMNQHIGRINAIPKYRKASDDGTLLDDNHPITKKYHQEYMDSYIKEMQKVLDDSPRNLNPTGTKKLVVRENADFLGFTVSTVDVTHSSENVFPLSVRFIKESNGMIKGLDLVEDSMSQTAELGAEALEHFGVKGMKWGVRKEALASGAKKVGRGAGTALTVAGDIQFENMARDGRAATKIEWDANGAFHRTDLPKINAKPEYQAARKLRTRLRHPRDPIVKQYRQEIKTTYIKRLEEAANRQTNMSGTRQYTIRERGWELPPEGGDLPTSKHFYEVSTRDIVHAGADDKPFYVELTLDRDGFVTDIKPVDLEDSVEHTMDLGAAFLAHFGIKGMKWGVRRDAVLARMHEKRVETEAANREKRPAKEVQAYPTIGPSKRTHARVDTKGGQDHPPTEDAVKVAVARQKLKKSGVDALSNAELKDVANRLQLEVQVKNLESKAGRKSLGRQFIESIVGDKETQRKVGEFATAKVAKTVIT